MFVWTQVGSIVFPVFAPTLVSPSQKPVGIETNVPRTVEDNPLPAISHVPSGKRKPTTSTRRGDPEMAKSSTTVKDQAPTRKTPTNNQTWCSIRRTSLHSLVECKVLLHVKAKLDACKEQDIQHTSPYKVWSPIHKSKSHPLTSCKVFLDATRSMARVPYCPIYQSRDQSQATTEPQDHVIAFIDKSPREAFVPRRLNNEESSGSNFSREVKVIDGATKEVREDGEVRSDDLVEPTRADDSTRTPANT
uniref:Retrotransposon protein-like n=1 Tax=Oryza punctata TaxID=4537 RepID=A0A0E0JH21_ORYPU